MDSSGEITEELMQQMLRELEKDSTIEVLPCLDVDELSEELQGGRSLVKVTVRYTRHGDTLQHSLSLIVRGSPKNSSDADAIEESNFTPVEMHMYYEILPRMSALLAQALSDRHTDFTARVYYARKIPSHMVALEDLSVLGFKTSKCKQGLDLKHCLLAFRTVARFHAASVMVHREDENLFDIFEQNSFEEEDTEDDMKKMFDKLVTAIAQAIETWPEFGPEWADRLQRRYRTLREDIRNVLKRDDESFNVLNYGDFGQHNVLYRHSASSGEVEAIRLVDFQCCNYNSPVMDLHQFIFGSADDEVRENHTGTLLKEYHAELAATLESLGAPREQIITLSQLLDEFDRKMLYSLSITISGLPFLSNGLTTEDVFGVNDDGIEKLQPLLTDSYVKSLKKLLPIFSQKQLI